MGSESGKSTSAHRGDSKKRDMDVTCFNCGGKGHKARQCKKGASSGGGDKLIESVKDAIDRAAGAGIAAAELSSENKELKEQLRATTATANRVAEMEAKLVARDAQANAEVDAFIKRISTGAPVRVTALADHVWAPVLICILVSIAEYNSGEHEGLILVYRVIMCVAVLWGMVCSAIWGFWKDYPMTLRFLEHVKVPDLEDRRPDANALQELKHKDPKLIRVGLSRPRKWNEFRPQDHWPFKKWSTEQGRIEFRMIVSAELLSQLTAPRYQSLGNSEEQAWDRILRGVETNQTVNQDRYRALNGENIPMNTALIALHIWRQYRTSVREAGFVYPRDQ